MFKYINFDFSHTDWNDINKSFDQMSDQLPQLINLSPDDRKRYGSMKEIHSALVAKTVAYATEQPAILPGFIDLDILKKEIEGSKQIESLLAKQEMLTEGLKDTVMAAKSSVHRKILDIYATLGRATAHNIVGVDTMMADLKQYFEKYGIRGEEVEQLVKEAIEADQTNLSAGKEDNTEESA